ncbi:KpsF/GutQ family sugar-phosphate isomerase [Echinimonas agarilytica]|uniref:Arabinose 5-phosphate isomerase n=1 Tax=Echinimonas agarilytica TaxID=1215918 RepID=A0AA41W489_9GAMM|nr:KpsF/GutQ family sugar-phosphate isomerase [Echinimonas agarilytica]MCM2678616.1 KpsF/GutQ family sugar-phosphate isomerase [Echinimonas agarilytica]
MNNDYIAWAKEVIQTEAEAVSALEHSLDTEFVEACKLLLACKGRVVVTGMGKSGHIGNKIAATLASTGTPAFFVHPGEASHGDLGMITAQDVVIAISYSGETDELTKLLPVIKRIGTQLIGISRSKTSSLGQYSDCHLQVKVEREACPLNLAPTTSTTATLVLGDALAIALLHARGFSAEDFALSHPGGSLGRRLLLTLKELMHGGDSLPVIQSGETLNYALKEMSRKQLGMTAIVDADGKMIGLFTDGDLRRVLNKGNVDIESAIDEVMTKNGVTAQAEMLAAEALKLMEDKRINGLFVVDSDGRPVGALNMQDLLRSGVL